MQRSRESQGLWWQGWETHGGHFALGVDNVSDTRLLLIAMLRLKTAAFYNHFASLRNKMQKAKCSVRDL
jgi:hypothetical protein